MNNTKKQSQYDITRRYTPSKLTKCSRRASGLLCSLLFAFSITGTAQSALADSHSNLGSSPMKIRFVFDDQTIHATLNDTPTTRDFVRQLPLSFELEDYASTEKIAYLPEKLTREGAPSGTSARAGDIAYYAPWGNMVIFYRDFGHANGLIHLGKIDAGLKRFTSGQSMVVTIELDE